MPTTAQISQEKVENAYVIHMSGEIDVSNLPELEGVVNPLVQDTSVTSFVLDAGGLDFIDSKVVGYMAYLYSTLSKSGRKIVFAQTNSTINDILTLVGLTNIVSSYPTLDEALNSLK